MDGKIKNNDEDLFEDLRSIPPHHRSPKSRISFKIIISVLLIITILAVVRAVRLIFPEWYYNTLELIKNFLGL